MKDVRTESMENRRWRELRVVSSLRSGELGLVHTVMKTYVHEVNPT